MQGGHIFYYGFCFCLPERWARYATSAITFVMAVVVVCVEALALAAGRGSMLSLVLVAAICMGAVLMSCATSYDSYAEHKRLTGSTTVGVGAPDLPACKPVRLQEFPV